MMNHCGHEVAEAALMCPSCGAAVAAAEPTVTAPAPWLPTEQVKSVPVTTPGGTTNTSPPPAHCSAAWCRRPVPADATSCDYCGTPLAERTPTPAPALALPDGTRLPLAGRVLLGREADDPRVRVALAPFEGVSRRHAEVSWTGGHLDIVDLEALNGTYVEGVRVRGQHRIEPARQVELRLGLSARVLITWGVQA